MAEKELTIDPLSPVPKKYDALLVLGAVMKWHNERGRWEFPTFIEHYPAWHVAGNLRAAATSLLHEQTPRILVTGGSDTHPQTGEKFSRAEILARLMVERFNVPEIKVEPIGSLGRSTTKGNVEDIAGYLKMHPEIQSLVILSPRFQAMRSNEMFANLEYETGRPLTVEWKLAERIIEDIKPSFRELYSNPVCSHIAALYCAQMERQGRVALRTGSYTQADISTRPNVTNIGDLNDYYDCVINRALGLPDPF